MPSSSSPPPRWPRLADEPRAAWAAALLGSAVITWMMVTRGDVLRQSPYTAPGALVALLVLLGGFWSLALASLVLLPGVAFFLFEPIGSFAVAEPVDRVRLTVYVAISFAAMYTTWRLRMAQQSLALRAAALAEKETQHRQFLEQTSDAIVVVAPPGRLLLVNQRTCEMFGYTEEELLSLPVPALFAPGELEKVPLRFLELEANQMVLSERRLRRKDGTIFEAELSTRRTADGNANVIARDITGRREQERARQQETGLLQSILETSVAAVTVLNPQGEIIFANHRAEAVLGIRRDAITERRFDAPEWQATALDGGPWAEGDQPFVRVLRSGEPVDDVRHAIVWPDGRRRYLSINGAPVKNGHGEIELLVFLITDITEQYETERRREEAEHRLRGVIAAMPGAVYQYEIPPGGRHRFTFVSDQIHALLHGPSPAEILANPDAIFSLIHPDDVPGLQRSIEESYTSLAPWQYDYRSRGGDGAYRWLRGTSMPERLADGTVRWNGIIIDITERKLLEEALLQAQKMESVGRLAGGVAHDFNNILTVIRGHAELLRGTFEPGDPRVEDLDELRTAAERATVLTRQLLALGRRQVLQPREVDLQALVLEMERLLRRVIGEQVVLVIPPVPDAGWVRADPGQLEQVLLNLVVNARDAMPNGGTLTIETYRQEVRTAADVARAGVPAGDWMVLRVTDNGIGMDPATQSRIFEPFFTTKEVGKGTGLGLATVYGIVEQSEGHVRVDSSPGMGSTFRVFLPRLEEEVRPAAPPPRPRPSAAIRAIAQADLSVLLCEDDDAVRALVRKMLEDMGWRVTEARHGEEALALADRCAPALLVTDVVMPGLSGPDLVRRLTPRFPSLPVLYMSGYVRDEVLEHSGGGRQAFLQKPFSAEALRGAVGELMAGQGETAAPARQRAGDSGA